MPRKLPWQTSSSTTVSRPKRPAVATALMQKRQKVTKDAPESEGETLGSTAKSARAVKERPGSSSPPPSPPPESFMIDGMNHDDKYRMVEDEFLTVAQQFTVHLHAAEYKRQQKMAKTRNAETISSISRPVTGKMPDQTKRKAEAVVRAKAQNSLLENLVGKKVAATEMSDDSDDGGLPYVGTTLHGLMDSPRKKAKSLSELSAAVPTRAAAGFKQPASGRRTSLGSPTPRQNNRPSDPSTVLDDNDDTASSDYDDDLDAAPKLASFTLKPVVEQNISVTSVKQELETPPKPSQMDPPARATISGFKEVEIKTEAISSEVMNPPKSRPRLLRLEQARQWRAKEEQEQSSKKTLDIIPTFL